MFAFLTGRPMADHCASILRPQRCVCLHPASFERPVSDRPSRRPLCDCFEHAQNFTATMASMAMPERPCTTLERPRQPFCLPSAFNGDLDSFVVAQGRHRGRSPCVKGVLLSRLFRRRSENTSKLRITGLCVGNSPGTS